MADRGGELVDREFQVDLEQRPTMRAAKSVLAARRAQRCCRVDRVGQTQVLWSAVTVLILVSGGLRTAYIAGFNLGQKNDHGDVAGSDGTDVRSSDGTDDGAPRVQVSASDSSSDHSWGRPMGDDGDATHPDYATTEYTSEAYAIPTDPCLVPGAAAATVTHPLVQQQQQQQHEVGIDPHVVAVRQICAPVQEKGKRVGSGTISNYFEDLDPTASPFG